MNVAGIIAEYNPFHNGHAYMINQVRSNGATHIVAVMSGNFVQRGEPALMPTSSRVKAALDGGVDLVLQLPVPYAVSGAAGFARGGVSVLNATGVVNSLAFGSECGDAAKLKFLSDLLLSGKADAEIKAQLETGITYAAARENAVKALCPDLAQLLTSPNDILATEYINALSALNSAINPVAIKRIGAAHDSAEKSAEIASASEIRRMISAGEDVSDFIPYTTEIDDNQVFEVVSFNKFETAVLYKMRMISAGEIVNKPDISEGIENRIYEAARSATTLDELYSLAKTKRYTHARIRRIVLNTVLEITAEDASMDVPYIRALGFNERGAELIREMKTKATLPVITKAADLPSLTPQAQYMFNLESRATDFYTLLKKAPDPCGDEKNYKIIVKKSKKS